MKKITKIISILGIVFAFGFIINQEKVLAISINATSTPPIVEGKQCHGFYTNLQFGDYNKEVTFLVNALIKEGILTNFNDDLNSFNENVYNAVISFQGKYGIPQTGYVGTLTRAKLNSLYGCIGSLKPIAEVEIVSSTSTEPTSTKPIIESISKSSGPIGTILEVKGKNLSGFEGDLDLILERSQDGSKVILTDYYSYSKTRDTLIKVVVKEPCKKGEVVYGRYSGNPSLCNYVPLVPGVVYNVYVNPWGTKSNEFRFTVTSTSTEPTPTILPISSPIIKSINPVSTGAGNPITVSGSGFTSKMQVNILGKAFSTNVTPYYVDQNGSRMSFVLPSISSGTYSLSVIESNTKLNSNYVTLSVTSAYPSVSPTYTTSPSYSPTYSPTPSVIYKANPTYSSSPTYTSSPSPSYTNTSSPVPTTTASPTYTTSPTSTYRPTNTTSPSPSSVSRSVNSGVSMGATILNSISNLFGF